jgi:hypothetical protein
MRSAIVMLASGLWSAMDPGCGLAVGENAARNVGDGGASEAFDSGSLPQVDCGPLGTHYFCDDFSEPVLPALFDPDSDLNAGALALDPALFLSAPQSLRASTEALTNATQTRAWLRKGFTASGRRFLLGFAEWVDPACIGANDLVQTGAIALDGRSWFLGVAHGTGNDSVLEVQLGSFTSIHAHTLPSSLPRGQWVHVVLDADLANGTMALTVDGAVLMQGEPFTTPPASPQVPAIQVGAQVDNITFHPDACTVHVDDVTFDLMP